MDLNILSDITRTIDIKHPGTKEPIGLRVELVSQENPVYKAARRVILNERMKMEPDAVTPEFLENQTVSLLASAFKSWEWLGDACFNGEKLECTPANIKKLLGVGWIKNQIDLELGKVADFFPS